MQPEAGTLLELAEEPRGGLPRLFLGGRPGPRRDGCPAGLGLCCLPCTALAWEAGGRGGCCSTTLLLGVGSWGSWVSWAAAGEGDLLRGRAWEQAGASWQLCARGGAMRRFMATTVREFWFLGLGAGSMVRRAGGWGSACMGSPCAFSLGGGGCALELSLPCCCLAGRPEAQTA